MHSWPTPHLFPEEWKKDELGNTRYIFFWGLLFSRADGSLFVRYCYFNAYGWITHYRLLIILWRDAYPAARLAS